MNGMRKHIAIVIPSIILCALILVACVIPPPTPTVSPVSPIVTPAVVAVKSPTPPVSVIIKARPTNTPYPTRTPVMIVPGNLLIDPSLEGPYVSDGKHPEVNTSKWWSAWYSCGADKTVCEPPCRPLTPGCSLPCPVDCIKPSGNCQPDYGCYWMRAEYNPFNFDKSPNRVHSGDMAQVYFSYGRMSLGGIQQTVPVTPGQWLRFTAYIQAWQCYAYGPDCDWGRKSDKPSDMHLRIGIDPTGGTDVNNLNVIWSPEREAYDRWVEFIVIAQAQSNRVTVFTQGGATFDYARMNNDVYIDDLALVAIGQMTNTIHLPVVIQ